MIHLYIYILYIYIYCIYIYIYLFIFIYLCIYVLTYWPFSMFLPVTSWSCFFRAIQVAWAIIWPRWTGRTLQSFPYRSDANFQIFVQSIPKGRIITCTVFSLCSVSEKIFGWKCQTIMFADCWHCRCTSKATCRPVSEVGTFGSWDADQRKRYDFIYHCWSGCGHSNW